MGCCSCWSSPSTKDAYRLSIASLFITVLGAWAGIGLFKSTGSSLCLVYGLENIVDFLSSVVVLWRFFAPSSVDPALEAKLQARETRASIAISFIMILLGFCVVMAALSDFNQGKEKLEELGAVIGISFWSIVFFGVLSILKFRYSAALDSPSLYKDGICSLIGTVLASALFVDSIIIAEYPNAWWMDPVVAFLAGLYAMYAGIVAILKARKEGLAVFTKSWWFTKGDPSEQHPSAAGTELPPAGDAEVV